VSDTGRLSLDQPNANMFGVVPCPKCGSAYRFPSQRDATQIPPHSIICDDCGFVEPIA
jgi:predicted RNA-binding Zn-ribbon protein involved in translation (DUF1610 family)